MSLTNTKSILAKLLAAENITIEHRSTSTAYFDLKNRVLTCPTWVDMDGELYDLLMGHEVGHALNTPLEGWHDAVLDNKAQKKFKSFLNVIEDARIERMIKRTYPGLSRSFNAAYKQLAERDFFGIKKLPDTDKLSLIDRINLRCKLGTHVIVKFNDAEREFLREVETCETWEQVVDIATRVYAYVKENEADKLNSVKDLEDAIDDAAEDQQENDEQDFGSEDESDEDSDTSEYDESDEDSDEETESGESSDDSDDEETDSDKSTAADSGSTEEENDDEPESVTDRMFRERERELVNESGAVHMMNLPDGDLKKIIKKNLHVVTDFEASMKRGVQESIYGRNGVSYEQICRRGIAEFNKNNKKYITHILKEFEMRKRASEYARTQTAKTGELDLSKLHGYKFTNDLFKKISIVPKGKNHGMILFLDMSGSMQRIFRNTVEQLMVLISFCKLANIPFEVYGFSNASCNVGQDDVWSKSPNEIQLDDFHFRLLHLIGSGLNKVQYQRAFNMLAFITTEYGITGSNYAYSYDWNISQYYWNASGFGLNSTPTLQTLAASREIINNFRAVTKADVVNVMYLTDGVGDNNWWLPKSHVSGMNSKAVYYIVDKKTKKKVRLDSRYQMQNAMTQLVRDVTGCKHIGFYLIPRQWVARQISSLDLGFDVAQKARESVKNNNFFSSPSMGFDNYFYVGADSAEIKDEDLQVTSKMTKAKMASVFKKHQRGKSSNRVLVSRFAAEIAA